MKDKVSKIATSKFSNQWTNPSGGTTYYFDITFENGDVGAIGTTDMNSEKVRVGNQVTYSIINNKIKINPMSNELSGSQFRPTYSGNVKPKTNSHSQFLGFAFSYAKDLIIAGKGMKDVQELNEVARYIYNEIGNIMNENK